MTGSETGAQRNPIREERMENPWKTIRLSDYEAHMKLQTVRQQQTLSEMMYTQLRAFPAESAMILGVAGGNGLEHLEPGRYAAVYGVDVNPDYLRETAQRYGARHPELQCLCIDLNTGCAALPRAGLVIANLLIEYIGCAQFQNVIRQVQPRFVSCGIQVDEGDGFVSESPYLHAFDGLEQIHRQISAAALSDALAEIGYQRTDTAEYPLPNGKKLVRADFSLASHGEAADPSNESAQKRRKVRDEAADS